MLVQIVIMAIAILSLRLDIMLRCTGKHISQQLVDSILMPTLIAMTVLTEPITAGASAHAPATECMPVVHNLYDWLEPVIQVVDKYLQTLIQYLNYMIRYDVIQFSSSIWLFASYM